MERKGNSHRFFTKDEKQKAIDYLLWINFCNRATDTSYNLFEKNDRFSLMEKGWPEGMYSHYSIAVWKKKYRNMKYSDIQKIAQDKNPLKHWEIIRGLFSVMDGEVLRYMLHAKIPLEKFIRYELASRGFDKNHQWCGFEKAKEIWLK